MTAMLCSFPRRARSLYMPTAALLVVGLLVPGCVAINDNWTPVMGDSDADTTGRPTTTTPTTSWTSSSGAVTTDTSGSDDDDDDDTVDTYETSETSDTESTEETTSDSSDNTGGGAVCGDDVVEGPEDCDDGNTEEGDGCSDACHEEPSAIALSVFGSSDLHGADEGPETELVCGEQGGDGLLVGFDVSGEGSFISQLAGDCIVGAIELVQDKLEIVFKTPFPTPNYGGSGGMMLPGDSCPPGHVVRGIRGYWYQDALAGVELACSKIKIFEGSEGFEISIEPEAWEDNLVGYMAGAPFGPYLCPSDMVAAGAKVYDGGTDRIFGIKLSCYELELFYE